MTIRNFKGITLIELLVVIIILSILSILIYPSFVDQVIKSRRSEALTNILKIQAAYEEYNAQNGRYPDPDTLPPSLSIPSTSYYDYGSDTTDGTYTISAYATTNGNQNTDNEDGVDCSTISIDNTGAQSPVECWNQ